MPNGYHGRILHVDLTEGHWWGEELGLDWYRRYGGGGALGGYFLLRDMDPKADALDAGNLLIFSSSVLAGLPVPGASKHAVIAKSPLTLSLIHI